MRQSLLKIEPMSNANKFNLYPIIKLHTYITALILICGTAEAQRFDADDWITYRDFRYVLSGDVGRDFIYLVTTGGICRWDRYRQRWGTPISTAFTGLEAVSLDTVFAAGYDNNTGYLWCGASSGLFSYETMSDNWEKHILPMGNPTVYSIGVSVDKIWVEAADSYYSPRILFSKDPTFGMFIVSSPGELQSASPVKWQGERGVIPGDLPQYFVNQGGYNFGSDCIYTPNMEEHQLTCYLNDGWGYSWLGFFGSGIGRVDDNTNRMDLYLPGPSGRVVRSLLMNSNTAWIGGSGLVKWQRKQDKWEQFQWEYITGLDSDSVEAIAENDEKVFFATDMGLAVYDKKSGRFHMKTRLDNLTESHVTCLAVDRNELWIGSVRGISVMNFKENSIIRIDNPRVEDRYIYDIAIDGSFVWAGTYDGLYLHDRMTGDWTYVLGSPELEQSEVRTLQAGEKEIWTGRFLGVEYFDKDTGEFHGYPSVLYGNRVVNDLTADSAVVWLATNGGLVKHDRKLNRWVRFTRQDGLPSGTVYVLHKEGDYLWLGTANGLTR
ncbi:MAG: hypothetical protein H8E87_07950, partial [FCB group bacterium]|nr:hypothetical protein [FCB group bacterium]